MGKINNECVANRWLITIEIFWSVTGAFISFIIHVTDISEYRKSKLRKVQAGSDMKDTKTKEYGMLMINSKAQQYLRINIMTIIIDKI